MRKIKNIPLCCLFAVLLASSAMAQQTKNNGMKDSLSYALGIDIANSLKKSNITNIDVASLTQAINDVFTGNPKMTEEQAGAEIRNFLMAQQNADYGKNVEIGKEFLIKNKTKAGVVELPSGLQYKILTQGTGNKPVATDEVEVHYRGTLIDGREFDSSYKRGQTATFPLNQVIKGWTEGLQYIQEGGLIELYVPADLAYGDRAMPGSIIEPGSTLIFEVSLVKIVKK